MLRNIIFLVLCVGMHTLMPAQENYLIHLHKDWLTLKKLAPLVKKECENVEDAKNRQRVIEAICNDFPKSNCFHFAEDFFDLTSTQGPKSSYDEAKVLLDEVRQGQLVRELKTLNSWDAQKDLLVKHAITYRIDLLKEEAKINYISLMKDAGIANADQLFEELKSNFKLKSLLSSSSSLGDNGDDDKNNEGGSSDAPLAWYQSGYTKAGGVALCAAIASSVWYVYTLYFAKPAADQVE